MHVASRKTFSGAGRPRKATRQGVQRYGNGRIVNRDLGESEADVMRTAVGARARHLGMTREAVKDDASVGQLGTVLGRLLYSGTITKAQHAVAVRFARVVNWQGILDDVRPGYGIPAAARIGVPSGSDPYSSLDPELSWDGTDARRRHDLIARIRRDYADLTRVGWEMEAQEATRGAMHKLTRAVLWDDDSVLRTDEDRGTFRCGLNVIGKLWGML